jgi:lysophospholipase L1-like esterase
MAKYSRRVRFVLILALAILFFVEVSFRLLFTFSNLDIKAFIKNSMYTADPLLGYALKPGFSWYHRHQSIKINANGFRGDEINETKNLVFCVGGSTTFGAFNSQNETWPHLLDSLIKKETDNWQFINAGVPGYNSWQGSTRIITEIVHFYPKLIIVSHIWNDLNSFTYPAHTKNFRNASNLYSYTGLIGRNYYSYIMFNAIYRRLYFEFFENITEGGGQKFQDTKDQVKLNIEALKLYTGNIERLISELINRGIKIILLDEPYLHNELRIRRNMKMSDKEANTLFSSADNILTKLSEKYKIPYIRLNEKISINEDLMDDHVHPNIKGNLLIAEEIKHAVQDVLFTSQ